VSTPRHTHWEDAKLFLGKFLKHGIRIASITPSSLTLSRAMTKDLRYDTAKIIVELGPGTGVMTTEILKKMRPRTRLLLVENDPDFCRILRERFPEAEIIEGSAKDLTTHLATRGITQVDEIVCGLPLALLKKERIFAEIAKCLSPSGTMWQLTEIPWLFLPAYKKHFHNVRFHQVLSNIPPGGYYECRGAKRNV